MEGEEVDSIDSGSQERILVSIIPRDSYCDWISDPGIDGSAKL